MCIFSYLHYHHQHPCTQPPSLVLHYSYCAAATTIDSLTKEQMPCLSAILDPVHSLLQANPCARGGCLIAPACSSGACRLQDLNGRWVCCKCKRGGNVYRCCHQRKKGCPDTFCYHDVCESCTADV